MNTEDLNEVIKYHDNIQKKLTDDMLEFTKTLKEQSELANKIIKKDTEVSSNIIYTTLLYCIFLGSFQFSSFK